MSEHDYLAQEEETLRRLSEPEGDHELHTALERMRVHHPHVRRPAGKTWKVRACLEPLGGNRAATRLE